MALPALLPASIPMLGSRPNPSGCLVFGGAPCGGGTGSAVPPTWMMGARSSWISAVFVITARPYRGQHCRVRGSEAGSRACGGADGGDRGGPTGGRACPERCILD